VPSGKRPATAQTQLNTIIAGQPAGAVSVAALNVATGASISAGANGGMWTASAYKLLMLEILLWQNEKTGTLLSSDEDQTATEAIENSDNAAGYQLWLDVGGNTGQAQGMQAFGMAHSAVGQTDPAFTTLTGSDALIILKNLVSPRSPLDANARQYVLNLMANVEADQRWGVGAAADPGTQFYNKNGWLSVDDDNDNDEDDNGLWITTSLGIITVHGQQVLMAVLAEHQPDFDDGVQLVEQLAKIIAPAVG
jgi:beta-lactamase class A